MFQIIYKELSFSQVSLHYNDILCYWRHINTTFLEIVNSNDSKMAAYEY
jgi:hypothetical protein